MDLPARGKFSLPLYKREIERAGKLMAAFVILAMILNDITRATRSASKIEGEKEGDDQLETIMS